MRTATQLPGSILQVAGRTVGFGIEQSEVVKAEMGEVKFERVSTEGE